MPPSPSALDIQLLDCTLRDGSYAVDFQFTAQDTWLIATALDQAGIPYIEIGHGLGLGASRKGHGVALEEDEAYCQAIAGKLQQARWGTFFIPGIGTLEDIDRLADFGAQFIRIGTDVQRVQESEAFIQRAKALGLQVFSNFMKSYSVPAACFVEYALMAEAMGTDVLVVVDSAGGMLPEDITRYTHALHEKSTLPLGFHGHNNLDLATANSLCAIEAGATFIDTSLQGLGRSAGNTITEIMALVLKKKGYPCPADPQKLMDIGEKFIKPLLKEDKWSSLSMTSGYAQFHSSFLEIVLRYADQYKIDPRELILHLTRESQTQAPAALVQALAAKIAQEKETVTSFRISVPDAYLDQPTDILKNAYSLARKQHKKLVYNLVSSETPIPLSRNVQQDAHYVLLNGQGPTLSCFAPLLKSLEGFESVLYLVDQGFEDLPETQHPVFTYHDVSLWAEALLEDLNETFPQETLYFSGHHPVLELFFQRVPEFQFTPTPHPHQATVLVSFNSEATSALSPLTSFQAYYDAVIGGFETCLEALSDKLIYRIQMAPALFSLLKRREAYRNLSTRRGRHEGEAFPFISGGVIGKKGEIVVDDYRNPKVILGVADGRGSLEQELESYYPALHSTQSYISGLGL